MKNMVMPLLTLTFKFTLLLIASFQFTETAFARGGDNIYFGAGLLRSMATYKSSSASSNFDGWGASAIIGFDMKSYFFEGEYGLSEASNTFQSASYLEKSKNTYISAKAGLNFGAFGIGGGAQQNNIDVDNVATIGSSGRTSYRGLSYLGFARLTFEGKESYSTVFEVKYGVGSLSGLELGETQLNLRFVFSPF